MGRSNSPRFGASSEKKRVELMTWLVIVVVLAAAFAPVAYMMPSKRERALADLRMVARREGLEVDVTYLPKLDAEPHERVSASGKAREARLDCVSYGQMNCGSPCSRRMAELEHGGKPWKLWIIHASSLECRLQAVV